MATDISDIRSLVRCKVTAAAMTALGLGRVKTLREKCAFRDPGIGARVG
jgi:hypothetical protein